MAYSFSLFKESIKAHEAWLVSEFGSLRTGRVSPVILDAVLVESYGVRMPINHVAAISIEDAKALRITPWDGSQLKAIEKALATANLGVAIAPDSASVRISFPNLTEDRRRALLKVVKTKLEEARVAIRQERDKTIGDIQSKEKTHEITEDDRYRLKDELQKLVDEANKRFDGLADQKEKEIMS